METAIAPRHRQSKTMEIRRSNGQCEYGQWLDIDDLDVPAHVREQIETEAIETQAAAGELTIGGQLWVWRD